MASPMPTDIEPSPIADSPDDLLMDIDQQEPPPPLQPMWSRQVVAQSLLVDHKNALGLKAAATDKLSADDLFEPGFRSWQLDAAADAAAGSRLLLSLPQTAVDSLRNNKNHERVELRHSSNDHVHVITPSETLILQRFLSVNRPKHFLAAQTAANQIGVDHLSPAKTVYFVARPVPARHGHLLDATAPPSTYEGIANEELEAKQTARKYSVDELAQMEMCSRAQLDSLMTEHHIVEIDGYARRLDLDYLTRVSHTVVEFACDEKSWPIESVDADACVATLQDMEPAAVLRHFFKRFATLKETDMRSELQCGELCRLYASALLNNIRKNNATTVGSGSCQFELQEFNATWRRALPDQLKSHANSSQLLGIAYSSESVGKRYLHYLPEEELPLDINERLTRLFRLAKAWPFDELKPYLIRLVKEDMSPDDADVEQRLFEFCQKHFRTFSKRTATAAGAGASSGAVKMCSWKKVPF